MNIHELVRNKGLRLGLSPRTIKTYQSCLRKFFRTTKKDPLTITRKDIEQYLNKMIQRDIAGSTINVYLASLKFFYEKVLNRKLTTNIEYSKKPKRLPEFLTTEELKKLLTEIKNPKHLLMIKVLYSAGLRVSEFVNLKVKDLEFDQNYGWVRQGKGKKDRLFIVAWMIKAELIQWIDENELVGEDYLFFSYQKGLRMSTRTVYEIVKTAAKKAKITKNVHPHTLRHSFATHLIQQGNSVMEVQPLLGHNSINTTMRYVHMASPHLLNVRSPLDLLG